jgi:hypothetical protein
MADYFCPTVIQQTIPLADMTALERLVLTRIFESEPDGDGIYFFAENGPNDFVFIPAEELKTAFAASAGLPSALRDYIAETVRDFDRAEGEVEIDVSGTSWEVFFQDIVRRSPTLNYLTVVTAFTCSKMRPDGFGGSATLITADDVKSMSTHDFLEELIPAVQDAGRARA